MVTKAAIKYRSLKSNLVHLPLSLYAPAVQQQLRPQSLIIHLKHLTSRPSPSSRPAPSSAAHLGWTGLASASSLEQYGLTSGGGQGVETVEIDPSVCLQLGWMEGDMVEISTITSPTKAKSISVTPLSSDDWEVLELHANYLEQHLLSQMRGAVQGQVVGVWLPGKHKIRIRIDETNPPTTINGSAVILTPDSEVFVAPRPRKADKSTAAKVAADEKTQEPIITSSIKQATANGVDQENEKAVKIEGKGNGVLRAVPERVWTGWEDIRDRIESLNKEDRSPVPAAYVSHLTFRSFGTTDQLWAQITPFIDLKKAALQDAANKANMEDKLRPEEGLIRPVVKLVPARGIPDGHMVVWPGLEAKEGEGDWMRYRVDLVKEPKSKKGEGKKLGEVKPVPVSRADEKRLAGVEGVVKDCLSYFQRCRMMGMGRNLLARPLLLQGPSGSGKTAISLEIASELEKSRQMLTSVVYIDCKADQGSGVLSVTRDLIKGWINRANQMAPCLMVLDGLEAVVQAEAEHVDDTQSRAVAEYFASCMAGQEAGVYLHPQCLILATTTSVQDLHPVMRVRRVFGKTIELSSPSQEVRRAILCSAVHTKAIAMRMPEPQDKVLDYTLVANMTEGYSASDLQDLVDNALKGWLIRRAYSSTGEHLDLRDFEKAIEESKPRSLRDVKLQTSTVEWADVGGLRETRATLRETLEWPTKYGAIFRNCPLRLRSGLLLYGYPGCGKTLLASAVAKECGLHFISVKGPELLNKYIGASEKSVRDIFARAKAAKPCVLFFDEFDSIAPKRGHDSTGVTDRVVNQLLTEMDGAEGLDGVYVLAATSRPDLIDSALLRPGRLDKSLLCGIPDEEDRTDILRAVSRKVAVASSIDWKSFAAVTEGYSGADLQSLLYNAQLGCVHAAMEEERSARDDGPMSDVRTGSDTAPLRHIEVAGSSGEPKRALSHGERVELSKQVDVMLQAYDRTQEDGYGSRDEQGVPRAQPIIGEEHLREALKETKPSLPVAEKRKLDHIYYQFVSGRSGIPPPPIEKGIGQRVSLM